MSRPPMQTPGVGHGGEKSLDYFDEKTPPGWSPNIPGYPWILYTKKLEMWIMRYRLAALPEDQMGPAMASRLRGQPWEIAMKLKLPKSIADGGPRPGVGGPPSTLAQFRVGPDALTQPEVPEQRHSATGAAI